MFLQARVLRSLEKHRFSMFLSFRDVAWFSMYVYEWALDQSF